MKLRQTIPHALFFLSGASGLGLQMVWCREFATGLGHELPSVLAVVAAIFGGFALGSWAADHSASRSLRPGRWYGGLEWVIGSWGLLSIFLIPFANDLAQGLIGLEASAVRQWTVAFFVPGLFLLPATAAMGATFPAMERFVAPWAEAKRCVGGLYAANTFGAVAGTLAGTLALLPMLGLAGATAFLAAISFFCGAAALVFEEWLQHSTAAHECPEQPKLAHSAPHTSKAKLAQPGAAPGTERAVSSSRAQAGRTQNPALAVSGLPRGYSRVWLAMAAGLTGLLGIGYEVLGVRVLSEVLENTVYSYAAVLSMYLAGTALGAAFYQRALRHRSAARLNATLFPGLATACLLGVWILSKAPQIYEISRTVLGDGSRAVWCAELLVAGAVFGLPTLLMGATFSHLVQSALQAGLGAGRAVAFNTLGSALAPAVFGVLLLPAYGAKWVFVCLSLAYLLLVLHFRRAQVLFAAALALLLFILPAQLRFVKAPAGGRVLAFWDGIMDSVAVIEHFDGNRSLLVNGRFGMGGTGAALAEQRHAVIPLLLHPGPKRALFLGLGTGITFAAAGAHKELRADGVELIPEVIEAWPWFEPHNHLPPEEERLRVFVADARRFVRVSEEQYDVIVADLFHPARDGAGSLYTVEHFESIRRRLAPGGLFCQWLPLYQLDEPMLRVITASFLEVFPEARAWLLRDNIDTPVLGLIGAADRFPSTGRDGFHSVPFSHAERGRMGAEWDGVESVPAGHSVPKQYPPDYFRERVRTPELMERVNALQIRDELHLYGCFVAGADRLRQFALGAALNTDNHPVVGFGAPRFLSRRQENSYGRLLRLVSDFSSDPEELIEHGSAGSEAFIRQLTLFIAARNAYLKGLVADAEGRQSEAIEAYLESARLSPAFSTGYAQCLTIAARESKTHPETARKLLERLIQAQPGRTVAEQLLRRLTEPERAARGLAP